MIKSEEQEECNISDAPVSQEDLLGIVLAGFDLKESAFSNTVFDFKENCNRERYYFTGNTWPIRYSLNRVSK